MSTTTHMTMCQLDNRNLTLRTKVEPSSSRLLLEGEKCGRRGGSRMTMTRKRKKIQTEKQTLSKIQRKYGRRRNGNIRREQHTGEEGEVLSEVQVEVLMWLDENEVRARIRVC